MNIALLTVISIAAAYLLVRIAGLSISLLRYWKANADTGSSVEESTPTIGTGSSAL